MPVSPPPTAPTGALRGRVALVVDVDGVVSAVHPTADMWGDEVTAGHFFGPVRVSPTLCRRLDELAALPHVVPLWLTSWVPESRARMDPFPGRDWATLASPEDASQVADLPADPDGLDWWKWDAVRAWLHAHPEIRSLVWCDDHLGGHLWDLDPDLDDGAADDDGDGGPAGEPWPLPSAPVPQDAPYLTTAADVIAARLAADGITATLVAPQTAVGLTPGELDRIEAALVAAKQAG